MLCLWAISLGHFKVKSGVEMFLKKKSVTHTIFHPVGPNLPVIAPTRICVAFFWLFFEKENFCIAVIYHTLHCPENTQSL